MIPSQYPKYSNEWIQSLSDSELDIEREEIRKAWCSEPKDLSRAVELESILDQFDREIHKRKSSDSSGYSYRTKTCYNTTSTLFHFNLLHFATISIIISTPHQ